MWISPCACILQSLSHSPKTCKLAELVTYYQIFWNYVQVRLSFQWKCCVKLNKIHLFFQFIAWVFVIYMYNRGKQAVSMATAAVWNKLLPKKKKQWLPGCGPYSGLSPFLWAWAALESECWFVRQSCDQLATCSSPLIAEIQLRWLQQKMCG